MTTFVVHSLRMTKRSSLSVLRQPTYILSGLVQPIIYLYLFTALFKNIVQLPGFGASSYLDFLTPGIVVMTILYNRAYGGYFMVRELHLGVIDRFLVTPISRAALICGQLINGTLVSVVQVVILLVLARIQGAEYPGGIAGLLILVLASMMLGIAVGAASQGFALVSRQEDTIIAVISCVILPLTFLSSTLMATSLMPGWLRDIAHYNPVNWAVEAGRSALSASPDWSLIGWRFGALFVVMIACLWLATRGFRSYQKSI